MSVSRDQFVSALVAEIRDALIEGHRIQVPGLGVFSVRHIASKMQSSAGGSEVMLPPRDVIEFEKDPDTP